MRDGWVVSQDGIVWRWTGYGSRNAAMRAGKEAFHGQFWTGYRSPRNRLVTSKERHSASTYTIDMGDLLKGGVR